MPRDERYVTHLEKLSIAPKTGHGDATGDYALRVYPIDTDPGSSPSPTFYVTDTGYVACRAQLVTDTTGAVTIAAADNGKTFLATKAAATTFTLPAPSTALAGMSVKFVQTVAYDMIIDGTADKMIVFGGDGTSKTATFGTTSEKIGASAIATCTGTMWIVEGIGKATITVA